MTITDIGDALRAHAMAWRDIPAQQRAVVEAALLPANGFDDQQRAWLSHWRLACTQADVDAINALLPDGVYVGATTIAGQLYLGGDLLTDAVIPGGTYRAALPVLETLVCTYIADIPASDVDNL